jgi:hypothetical protein
MGGVTTQTLGRQIFRGNAILPETFITIHANGDAGTGTIRIVLPGAVFCYDLDHILGSFYRLMGNSPHARLRPDGHGRSFNRTQDGDNTGLKCIRHDDILLAGDTILSRSLATLRRQLKAG